MGLISFSAAKESLRVTESDFDEEIAAKLADAENWAIDIMGANYDEAWDQDTVPGRVRRAILVSLRGDFDGDPDGKYQARANEIIERWRDHVIA